MTAVACLLTCDVHGGPGGASHECVAASGALCLHELQTGVVGTERCLLPYMPSAFQQSHHHKNAPHPRTTTRQHDAARRQTDGRQTDGQTAAYHVGQYKTLSSSHAGLNLGEPTHSSSTDQ